MKRKLKENDKNILPVLFLRGLVLFPGMSLDFDVGRTSAIEAANEAFSGDKKLFIINQKNVLEEKPELKDLNEVGVIAEVKKITEKTDGTIKILAEGLKRGKIETVETSEPFMKASISECQAQISSDFSPREIASVRMLKSVFKEYLDLSPQVSPEFVMGSDDYETAEEISDYFASNLDLTYNLKQELLNELNPLIRTEKLIEFLLNELDVLSIEQDINLKLMDKLEEDRRESLLREQKQIISQELGEEDFQDEIAEMETQVKKLRLPKDVKETLLSECSKISSMLPGSQEISISMGYLKNCLALPWNKESKEKTDIMRAHKILNKHHYGLQSVKERIIEMLAIKTLTKNLTNQIICLVGPPGVGKTSIVSSIAKAIGRKYAKISLGGVHDEADIRGHRKTYIGAMPGRIIEALKKAKTKNPVILLDEIDKITKDACGDPMAALLEVLDSEQNTAFYDHYLDFPFDLSNVLFIATANTVDTIPSPLLDRMDVIEVFSYTQEEKYNIAKKYIIPKQLKLNGLSKDKFKLTNGALKTIIASYTREAGVRNLERCIAKLMRKAAKLFVMKKEDKVKIDNKNLEKMLGPKKFMQDEVKDESRIGVATGLAWTKNGGETMSVEVATMPGTGKLELTGSLGKIMKESAQAAIGFIRSNAKKLKIAPNFHKNLDIHIHIPQGAIPKDGSSAGITLASAIISVLTNIPIKQNTAMTGEITLRGRVLPVGGLKEKTMAAYKSGINTVILPKGNKSDLSEIDDLVRSKVKFVLVDNMYSVLKNTLEAAPQAQKKKYKVAAKIKGKGSLNQALAE